MLHVFSPRGKAERGPGVLSRYSTHARGFSSAQREKG